MYPFLFGVLVFTALFGRRALGASVAVIAAVLLVLFLMPVTANAGGFFEIPHSWYQRDYVQGPPVDGGTAYQQAQQQQTAGLTWCRQYFRQPVTEQQCDAASMKEARERPKMPTPEMYEEDMIKAANAPRSYYVLPDGGGHARVLTYNGGLWER